jgi:hypothetical protein
MAFFYLLSFLARMFQSGFVMRLNHRKNPTKQEIKVKNVEEKENALLATENAVKKIKVSPPKQPVICEVNLRVMATLGSGFKKEKGHQIKSLSDNQL